MTQDNTVTILAAGRAEDGVRLVQVTASAEEGTGIYVGGLPDMNTKETLLRATTAMMSCGHTIPGMKIRLDISPHTHEETAFLDLAIALALICIGRGIHPRKRWMVTGELGLDGSVRGKYDIGGLAALAAGTDGTTLMVPKDNGQADPEGPDIEHAGSLTEALETLERKEREYIPAYRAYLVDIVSTVRVTAPEDASEDDIAAMAVKKAKELMALHGMDELICTDNVVTISEDTECPADDVL